VSYRMVVEVMRPTAFGVNQV